MLSVPVPRSVLDLRHLPHTRECIAYKDGGLFPVLAVAADGVVVAALRGGAGHLGLGGRIEIVRSLDGGTTWTPPSVVADSDRDDRNPALGVSARGTLVLAYHRQGAYDAAGAYAPHRAAAPDAPIEVMVTCSYDAGLTWERPWALSLDLLLRCSPYGKIVAAADGTLLMTLYGGPQAMLLGRQGARIHSGGSCSYLVRSHDEGRTWEEPTLIAVNATETALLLLPEGDLLAVVRDSDPAQALWSTRSSDGGRTWSEPAPVTGPAQHPADLVCLANGDVLLTYGNRTPPYRIEGLLSRDGGRSWLDCRLLLSGPLYGATVEGPRPTDLGYPSTVVWRGPGPARGVTLYYYNPSLTAPGSGGPAEDPLYRAQDYYAISVTWSEDELIAAVAECLRG